MVRVVAMSAEDVDIVIAPVVIAEIVDAELLLPFSPYEADGLT
jgi:predicted RNA methylase